MTEIEQERSTEIVLPSTGELVDLHDVGACASAVVELRSLEGRIKDAKRELTAAIAAYASDRGAGKTFHVEGLGRVQLKTGEKTIYDPDMIEKGLRDAGMAEDRIREIVLLVTERKVVASEAKKAANVNEAYAAVIEAGSRVVVEAPSVSVT